MQCMEEWLKCTKHNFWVWKYQCFSCWQNQVQAVTFRLFKKGNTIKQENLKKANCIRYWWRWRGSLHDETDDDENFEDSDKEIAKNEGDKQVTNSNSDYGKYFAVHWNHPRTYHWEKHEKVFEDDVDKQAEEAEFKFLQKRGIDGEICWDWPTTEDVEIVDIGYCF